MVGERSCCVKEDNESSKEIGEDMKLPKAIGGNIILTQEKGESVSKGGIILPDGVNEENTGTIVSVGSGREISGDIYPMVTKVGDVVIFGDNSALPFKLDGKEYLVMREADVLGTVE